MRFLLLLLFMLPSLAFARAETDVDSDPYAPLGTALAKTWDCRETMLDTRSKKGVGFAACLRGLAIDSVSGRSTAVVEVTLDTKDPLDLDAIKLKLQLDSGRTERVLEAFTVAADHLGDTAAAPPELFLAEWLEPTERMTALGPEDERMHLTLAWNFQTWDPSIPLKFLQLKATGAGLAGRTRWALPNGLGHDGDWDARPEFVWDEDWDDVACDVWRVRKSDAGKASDALSDGAHDLPLQMRFDVLSSSDDGEFEVHFPDHKFSVRIAGGKLLVRGKEDFTHPLGDRWLTGDTPNVMELVYDGEFVTVRVNDEVFGPMAGKQRDGKRFRWELNVEDGKNELRNVQVAPCTLEDPDQWVAPTPKETPAAEPRTASAPRRGRAGGPSAKRGKVVWAVLSKNGEPTGEVRKKKAKSALEVMTTAAAVGQGLMATGQGLSQFGNDVNTNLKAAKSGDYESMKSSDTKISVGPCGSSVTRSEASVSDVSTGNPTVHMKGERTNYSNPGCAGGVPIASSIPDGPMAPGKVCTLTVVAERDAEVRIGKEVLGSLAAGDRWVAQIAPGTHAVQIGGEASGLLTAAAGSSVTVTFGNDVVAEPAGALVE